VSIFSSAANRFQSRDLLEADGKGKVVSALRVVTADQIKAIIEQGTELSLSNRQFQAVPAFRKANLKLK
jgi:type IV pilus assembly protein PilQ